IVSSSSQALHCMFVYVGIEMKRQILGFLLIPLANLVFFSVARGQSRPQLLFIEPHEVLLPAGQPQSFQLLKADGSEGVPGDWVLSDPNVAELKVEGNHVVVTAKTVGHVTLSNSSGAQSSELVIHDGNPPMPSESRWILQPIDGQFTHALWASSTWGGSMAGADSVDENTPS